jgi:hypothetical protein
MSDTAEASTMSTAEASAMSTAEASTTMSTAEASTTMSTAEASTTMSTATTEAAATMSERVGGHERQNAGQNQAGERTIDYFHIQLSGRSMIRVGARR